jgi:hypothetical protein
MVQDADPYDQTGHWPETLLLVDNQAIPIRDTQIAGTYRSMISGNI